VFLRIKSVIKNNGNEDFMIVDDMLEEMDVDNIIEEKWVAKIG